MLYLARPAGQNIAVCGRCERPERPNGREERGAQPCAMNAREVAVRGVWAVAVAVEERPQLHNEGPTERSEGQPEVAAAAATNPGRN